MSDEYDVRLKQVEERNEFIVGHFVHTWRGRISDDTLYQHVLNIQSFTDSYLNYSATEADELRSADQITGWAIYDFVTDWLPRKCWVTSERRVKSYLASFKKFFKFMGGQGYMPPETVAQILEMIKEDRQGMIEAVVTYYDELEEDESPEAFRAHLQELVERWKAIHQESDKGAQDS